MAGYIRQSAASMISGASMTAAIFNAEFNQMQAAMHATTGHTHDGTTGGGAPIVVALSSATGILSLAKGGTAANLVDPNADRIMFWDDSAGSVAFLTPSTGLAITTTSIAVTIGTEVQAYDVDTLKADVADVLTAGFAATPVNAGTKSSGTFTPDEATGNLIYAVNGGAHTLAPPTNNCTLIIQYTNNGSAGAITTLGFTKVSGTFTTTNGDDFMCYITKLNGFSHLNVVALQ